MCRFGIYRLDVRRLHLGQVVDFLDQKARLSTADPLRGAFVVPCLRRSVETSLRGIHVGLVDAFMPLLARSRFGSDNQMIVYRAAAGRRVRRGEYDPFAVDKQVGSSDVQCVDPHPVLAFARSFSVQQLLKRLGAGAVEEVHPFNAGMLDRNLFLDFRDERNEMID